MRLESMLPEEYRPYATIATGFVGFIFAMFTGEPWLIVLMFVVLVGGVIELIWKATHR